MGPLLRIAAVTATAIVALSLALFAIDQSRDGSEAQIRAVDGPAVAQSPTDINRGDPAAGAEAARERTHSSGRELIDDANDVLVSPFTGLFHSQSVWAERLGTGALAMLLYGLGGLLLANCFPGRQPQAKDWRVAE